MASPLDVKRSMSWTERTLVPTLIPDLSLDTYGGLFSDNLDAKREKNANAFEPCAAEASMKWVAGGSNPEPTD